MRNPNRIPICLKLLFQNLILSKFLGDYPKDKYKKCGYAKRIHESWNLIEKTWLENPDLRFGQLLCNLRLIHHLEIENHIWNVEETIWLVDNNHCTFEEIHFWGINYFKNGKLRKTTKYKLLRDLDLEHIKNIIKFFKDNNAIEKIPQRYLNYFNKRINE